MISNTNSKNLERKNLASKSTSMASHRPETKYFYVFLAFIFVMPIWPNFVDLKPGGLPNIAPDRLLRVALYIGFVWIFFTNSDEVKGFKTRVKSNWILTSLLIAYYLIRLFSAVFAKESFAQLNNFLRVDLLGSLPIYFFALLAIKDEISVKKILTVLAISGVFSSIIALMEFHQESSMFASLIQANNDYTTGLLSDKTRDSVYRAQGSFEHPILLGQFFLMMIPIIWTLFKDSTKLYQSVFYIFATGLAFLSVYISGSRAAQGLALGVAMLIGLWEIYAWIKSSRNRILQYLVISQLPVPVLGGVAALYIYKDAAVGSTPATVMSTNARLDMFTGGIPKVLDAPILGHGLGEALSVFSLVGRSGIRTLDNYYLLLALESGLLAPILLLIILIVSMPSLRQIVKFNSSQKKGNLFAYALIFFSYIFELSIHSLPQQSWFILVIASCVIVMTKDFSTENYN